MRYFLLELTYIYESCDDSLLLASVDESLLGSGGVKGTVKTLGSL